MAIHCMVGKEHWSTSDSDECYGNLIHINLLCLNLIGIRLQRV